MTLEVIGKLTGELRDELHISATVDLMADPQWIDMRTTIAEALEAFPDAKWAVANAMRGLIERKHNGTLGAPYRALGAGS